MIRNLIIVGIIFRFISLDLFSVLEELKQSYGYEELELGNCSKFTFSQRAEYAQNPLAKKLFLLMDNKKTNLVLSADVTTKEELLKLADDLGSEICMLKTHIDIIEDFDQDLIFQLKELAKKHNFLILEDRKFADIGNTVIDQYKGGIYKISDWADIVTVYTIAGEATIEALKQVSNVENKAVILIAQLSSNGSLTSDKYTNKTTDIALTYESFVAGFITQEKISANPGFINFTPGVHISMSGDNLGQQYKSPEYVIDVKENDIIIVGRGILQAADKLAAAETYRQIAWNAYLDRVKS